MRKRCYTVTVTTEIMVVAENAAEAAKIARWPVMRSRRERMSCSVILSRGLAAGWDDRCLVYHDGWYIGVAEALAMNEKRETEKEK